MWRSVRGLLGVQQKRASISIALLKALKRTTNEWDGTT
jgi:hypothetical protein